MNFVTDQIKYWVSPNSPLIKFPILGVLVLAVGGGFVPTFAKLALEGMGSWTLLSIRFFFATLLLFSFIPSEKRTFGNVKELKIVSFAGFGNPLFLFLALPTISASIVPIAYSLTPALAYLFYVSFRGHKLEFVKILSLLIGVAGVSIVIYFDSQIEFKLNTGLVLLCLGVISFSIFTIFSSEIQSARDHFYQPIDIAFHFCLVSLLASIPFTFFEIINDGGLHPDLGVSHIFYAFVIGSFGTAWQYLFMGSMFSAHKAVATSLFTLLQPIIGVLLSVILLDEPLTKWLVIGGFMAIFGAKLYSYVPKST